jgi:hypothetical protein
LWEEFGKIWRSGLEKVMQNLMGQNWGLGLAEWLKQ